VVGTSCVTVLKMVDVLPPVMIVVSTLVTKVPVLVVVTYKSVVTVVGIK